MRYKVYYQKVSKYYFEYINRTKASGAVQCPEISAIDVEIVSDPDFEETTQVVELDQFSGFTCKDADQTSGTCYDHQVQT